MFLFLLSFHSMRRIFVSLLLLWGLPGLPLIQRLVAVSRAGGFYILDSSLRRFYFILS